MDDANTQTPAPADNPTAAAPYPAFDKAVAYVESRGYSHGAAIEIVNKEGIEKILASKAMGDDKEETPTPATATAPIPPASAPTPVGDEQANTSSNEVEKQAEAPAPGMKKCSACNIFFPGGYERCPNCNAQLW